MAKFGLVLVDDSFIDRTIVKKNMELFYPEMDVMFFASANEALAKFEVGEVLPEVDHGAILLDIYMPEMSGFNFVDTFGSFDPSKTKKFSIYMLSSSIDGGDMDQVSSRPLIKRFVSKPLNQAVLNNIMMWIEEEYQSSKED